MATFASTRLKQSRGNPKHDANRAAWASPADEVARQYARCTMDLGLNGFFITSCACLTAAAATSAAATACIAAPLASAAVAAGAAAAALPAIDCRCGWGLVAWRLRRWWPGAEVPTGAIVGGAAALAEAVPFPAGLPPAVARLQETCKACHSSV